MQLRLFQRGFNILLYRFYWSLGFEAVTSFKSSLAITSDILDRNLRLIMSRAMVYLTHLHLYNVT